MKQTKIQTSESFRVGIFLAIAGGYLDAYSYLTRGEVFANAQTGNLALFGISIAKQDFDMAIFYCIPIAAFAFGILLAQVIRHQTYKDHFIHWRQLVLLIEIALLCGTALVPSGDLDVWVNVAISFVCALQVETFRKIKGNTLATTMCTGNLRSATEYFYKWMENKNKTDFIKSLQYLSVIFFFVCGALLGAICTNFMGTMGTFVPAALLFIPFSLMFMD